MNILYASKLEEDAQLPTRKFWQDAGADLYSYEGFTIYKSSQSIVRTGITVKIPDGFVGLLLPKGKNYHLIGSGVIDSGYQGEILVRIMNVSSSDLTFHKGDAIAQLVIVPCLTGAIKELPKEEIHKEESARKATGGIVKQLSLLDDLISPEDAEKFMS